MDRIHSHHSHHNHHSHHSHQQSKSASNETKRWVCDYCNEKSFPSYEEACTHEKKCINNPNVKTESTNVKSVANESKAVVKLCYSEEHSRTYYTGSMPLSVDATDAKWLSEMNCYVRKNCIEVFSAVESKFEIIILLSMMIWILLIKCILLFRFF